MLRETATCVVARLSLSQCCRHFLLLKKIKKSENDKKLNMFTCIILYVLTLSLLSSYHRSLSHFLEYVHVYHSLCLDFIPTLFRSLLPFTLPYSLRSLPPAPHHISSLSMAPHHASSLSLAFPSDSPSRFLTLSNSLSCFLTLFGYQTRSTTRFR